MAQRKRAKEVVVQTSEQVVEEQLPRWKVISGGITLRDKRSFTKGDVFEANEWDIPEAFRDIIFPMEPLRVSVKKKAPLFTMREVVPTAEEQDKEDYVQLYEIISAKGKVVSEEPLPKEEIEEILKDMNP